MPIQDARALQEAIGWQFTLAEQNAVARYGLLDGDYWKQYLPHAVPFPELHPPKKILKHLYDMAFRRHRKR